MSSTTLTITHRSVFEFLSERAREVEIKTTRNILGCASKILEYLGSWTRWKSKNHRTEWFYQPLRHIVADLIEYGVESVRKSILFLIETGLIDRRINPRNHQDKTYQYKLILPLSRIESLHLIDDAIQGKDDQLAMALIDAGLASRDDRDKLLLISKVSEAADFVSHFSRSETQPRGSKSRSSGSENRQHHSKQTNIPSENSEPSSSPLPPKTAEPEEGREEEVLEVEILKTEEAASTQSPRTASETQPRQEIQLWGGIQGSRGALIGESTKHPALVYSGEDTPWLEQPSHRNARLGRPQWNQAFLEWGGARFGFKFEKADKYMAMGDFRRSLENRPDKILSEWEEYEGYMGATLQNIADRAAAGVTIDERDRDKLEKHHRALATARVEIPTPVPVLAEVAEVAHELRVESVDWDRIAREAEEAISVEVEPVVELPTPEPEYSTPRQFKEKMSDLLKSFSNRSLGNPKTRELKPHEEVATGTSSSSPDTDLVSVAISTNDVVLLNDSYVKRQLLRQEEFGLVSLEKEGDRIVSVTDRF